MDKNGSHFWNQRKKAISITHVFEKSSEKNFQNAEWCNGYSYRFYLNHYFV
jgi:hypothetical protein